MKALTGAGEDIAIKLNRLRSYMKEEGHEGVLLQRKDNFAWLTSGGFNGVPQNSDAGECGLYITQEQVCIVTNTIEKPRVTVEELTGLSYDTIEYPWYETMEDGLIQAGVKHRVASDLPLGQIDHCVVNLASLRYALTTLEVERLRSLGARTTAIMETFCMKLTPGMTEVQIAGDLNRAFMHEGLTPTVTLVGADERIDQYRHPVATKKPFYQKCMVIACVQAYGLTVALTRIVHAGRLPDSLRKIHEHTVWIDAELIAATKPGVRASQLLHTLKTAYQRVGYQDEWMRHHQGGAIGYENRDYLLTPSSTFEVQQWQPYAWNPSITGTKSEDTMLVNGNDSEIITSTQTTDWPMITVETSNGTKIERPAIYQL
ncbi:Xaa-Pro peptidase family protein [Thalassobacillus sp. CUG 92003]|uniref:M24 family metallopeptidase n=1 Tax=Thalassobacillus sp. CUG 92003 TaxID=2736641 RepID=UPI0015E63FC5|nr:aminopeptidase P family protein [Thalassobacillus sp. CUG 92003]